jgi:hypothetical protein
MIANGSGARHLWTLFSLSMIVFAAAYSALAQERRVTLACDPPWEVIDRCEAAGGRFDSQHCRCVSPRPPPACSLVCFDGKLDATLCRCVRSK